MAAAYAALLSLFHTLNQIKIHPLGHSAAPSPRFRLLRVYSSVGTQISYSTDSKKVIFEKANLRYLSLNFSSEDAVTRMLSFSSLLWNLQTLNVFNVYPLELTIFEIWKMPVLRHVMFFPSVMVPDPPNGEDNFVLKNLQTLSWIKNLKFSEEVVKRIPNIKKLKLEYRWSGPYDFCLHNLGRFQKLEDLSLQFSFTSKVGSFPHSLKKLSLYGTELSWEELTTRIGSLPLLQFLILGENACVTPKWETVEGHFCSLRVLKIQYCFGLQYWETEDCTHFPRLEYLHLFFLSKLKEIPLNIGHIPTLKRIEISECRKSALDSVERIKEEQEENGNEDLQVQIGDIVYGEEDEEDSQEEED